MTHSDAVICVKNLWKSWDRPVLKGISFDMMKGQSLVLIGGSGTGKSVLMKCLLGLVIPDQGQVLIQGQEVTHIPTLQRPATLPPTGVLFQGSALFDSLTVAENIGFPLIQRGELKRKELMDLVVDLLNEVGLGAEHALLRPSQLSGGMQRRVALARAIVERPKLMYFDEPTAGLDPVMSAVISDLIRASIEKLGATALTITHDIKSARVVGDRVAMLYEGEMIWQGPVDAMDQAKDERVTCFIRGERLPRGTR